MSVLFGAVRRVPESRAGFVYLRSSSPTVDARLRDLTSTTYKIHRTLISVPQY